MVGAAAKIEAIKDSSPVFVMGRGGSGTRMASTLVQELGFFFGNKINNSADSLEWKKIVLEKVGVRGASLGLPQGVSQKEEEEIIKIALTSLDRNGWVPRAPIVPWGFKIPPLLLVFPLWAEVFPNSKFIHMIRHPIPSSVGRGKRKADKTSKTSGIGAKVMPYSISYSTGETPQLENVNAYLRKINQNLLNAYSWNHQVKRAREYGREFLRDRYYETTYEEVCKNPQRASNLLAEFLEVPKTETSLKIRISPSSAYEKNSGTKTVWDICKECAEDIGYKY